MVERGRPKAKLVVSRDERETLEQWSRRRKTAQALAVRARIVLRCATGRTNIEVADALGVTMQMVGKWRARFVDRRLDGLLDEPRPGAPRQIADAAVELVVAQTLERTPAATTHWSVRTMAKASGLSPTTIHRIWQAFGLQPHRAETFKLSTDPLFIEKVRDIVGLYLNPPEKALVLCVDEKTGIQALDRTQPLLPLRAKKPRSWTNEYVRHGTQTLLAALEIASGQVVAQVKQRRTSVNFLRFLKDVVEAFPERDLHMVLDNLNIHKNQSAQRWLKLHPHVRFHYTPTHASWVNLVECFFSILGKQGLSQSVHTSKRQLKEFLLDYIAHNNENPRPFVWTKGPETLQRIIGATKKYQATPPRKPRRRRRRRPTRNTINN